MNLSTSMQNRAPSEPYREVTRYSPTYRGFIAGFLLLHAILMISGMISDPSADGRIPGTPIPWFAVAELAIVGWIWFIFSTMRQVVEVNRKDIACSYGPFGILCSYMALDEITYVSFRRVEWWERFRQRGNWWMKQKRFYLSGDWIVDVKQKNGWRWAIGTNDPDALMQAIRERMPAA